MKNSNDSLKEKETKQEKTMDKNELGSVSGGSQTKQSVKYVIDEVKCTSDCNNNCSAICENICPTMAIIPVNEGDFYRIDPNLCDGCGICDYNNFRCDAIRCVY
jgi:Pyruvate/2-oxoacid:ferredoxin oxidoreductase delta subunit